jgi:tetratricopeptide (TPR) repeat protein
MAKSVVLDPANSRYRNNLGLVLGHQGRYDEALAHFHKSGSEADAYYNLAFIFAAQDRVNKAKECFQIALNSDPTHRQAREALASFHEYDQRPKHLREGEAFVGEAGHWIPFVEGSGDGSILHSGDVVHASATGNAVTSRDASRATRALHMEARGMLNRNMHAQRADEMAAGVP